MEHMVSDDDDVAYAYPNTGTQDGPFNGIPATGEEDQGSRHAESQKCNSDTKIVERWGAPYEVGILQQIGALKPPAHRDESHVISALASSRTT